MSIINLDTEVHNVNGLTDEQKQLACIFIQGAVYAWIGTHGEKPFAVRDLFGGLNTWVWQYTPLDSVWRIYADKEDSFELAAKAAGKLLKIVLHKDGREFLVHKGYVNSYSWVPEKE